MSKESEQQEIDLRKAGWIPTAKHPPSPTWVSPCGTVYAGPGYAWQILQKHPNGELIPTLTPLPQFTPCKVVGCGCTDPNHVVRLEEDPEVLAAQQRMQELCRHAAEEARKASTPQKRTTCEVIAAATNPKYEA